MRIVRSGIAAVGVACLTVAGSGCGQRGPSVPRDQVSVLLLTLDTTRQDQLGCYGSNRGLTPNLDALARDGVLFEEAIAPVPLTLPSHCSILTGLYPFRHGVRANGWFRLSDEQVSIAETLQDAGFATCAVIGAYVLDHQFQIDQGFDLFDDDLSQGYQDSRYGVVERRAEAVTQSAISWLEEHAGKRFFLWVHYYDPHHSYAPPPEFNVYGDEPFDRYRGEIRYMDDSVGKVLDALDRLGLSDRTLIVAVGDHGEAFGEHQEMGHAMLVYNSTLHVPFLVRSPRIEGLSIRSGARLGGRVSLVDVAPTILDILGLEFPGPTDGRSLVAHMQGKGPRPDWPIYAESAHGKITRQWSQISGVYSGRWKYILAPTPELYDLSADPGEERNLAATQPSQAEKMKSELVALVTSPGVVAGSSARFEMDADAEDRLRSLGYVDGTSPSQEDLEQINTDLIEACQTGKDPKNMMEYNNLVAMATGALADNQPAAALRLLRKAREMEGDNSQLLDRTGTAYSQLKLFGAAIETFEKALEVNPNDRGAMNSLAIAYHNSGQSQRAIEILEEVVARAPHFYEHHLNLANVYDDTGRFALADREYEQALELAPAAAGKRQEVQYNMALSLFRRERYAEAEKILESAVQARPDYQEARALLGRVTSRLRTPRS